MKLKCKNCIKNFKMLTRDNLCALCSQKLKGKWPEEFTADFGSNTSK